MKLKVPIHGGVRIIGPTRANAKFDIGIQMPLHATEVGATGIEEVVLSASP